MVSAARDAISMQKICCQGNRRASVSEAAISPECQDCRCRRRAQRSTLAVFVSCSLHMRMLPFVAADIKKEFYICRLHRRHKRERQAVLALSVLAVFAPHPFSPLVPISVLFSPLFFPWVCLCLYIDVVSAFAPRTPVSSLVFSSPVKLRTASSEKPELTTPPLK